ncbi:methyl-accepting chemotaxis protein [Azonexus sp. IMCC34839]|uniref:methyl-accepting chemotaxis protein n=1 Tax=Azonexus sp. IMCC34839 TaxID=3133695 RepID=UPI00399B4E1E
MHSMKISHKLLLLVVSALIGLLATSIFAVLQAGKLNDNLVSGIERQELIVSAIDRARGAQVHFKTQVQEWKNILLRGKDGDAFAKHLKGFDEEERLVRERLEQVKATTARLGLAERLKIDEVMTKFGKLGPSYREALKQYDRNAADPAGTVDKLVRGMDREPSKAIDGLVAEIQTLSKEFDATARSDAASVYSAVKVGLATFAGIVLIALVVIAMMVVRSITVPLGQLDETISRVADSGDLTQRVQVSNRDEIGRVAEGFNKMMGQLQTIIREVNGASHSVTEASDSLAGSCGTLADMSHQQSSAVTGSAAAIEQLTVAITSVSDTAGDVQAQAVDSVEQTARGAEVVSRLVDEISQIQNQMGDIAQTVDAFVRSTEAITAMTQEVREIADQTNLLALNAAIEAARAGESGRGFAIVADEVRKLAEKSTKSAAAIDSVTRSIKEQSAAVQSSIASGEASIKASGRLAGEVEEVLSHSHRAVERSMHGVSDITGSVSEQKVASTEVARNMEQIANMVESSNASVQRISSAARDLRHLAQGLSATVAGFRVA